MEKGDREVHLTEADKALAEALETLATGERGTAADAAVMRLDRALRPLVTRVAGRWRHVLEHEDALQVVWQRLLTAAHQYDRRKGPPIAWLFGVVRFAVLTRLSQLQQSRRRHPLPLVRIHSENVSGSREGHTLANYLPDPKSPAPALRAETLDLYAQTDRALRLLFSRREYEVWTRQLAGQTYQEIADALGITVKSVDNSLVRADRKLAEVHERHPTDEGFLKSLLTTGNRPRKVVQV
jgi:RNA polymerase sigma factor (sigma-70 family)